MDEVCIIAFGGNLGAVRETIANLLEKLSAVVGIQVLRCSPLYISSPLPVEGGKPQPNYTNGVLSLRTSLEPLPLLSVLLKLEKDLGRDRASGTYWGPRVIDLDIIAYGSKIIDLPELQVPHPRYQERDFVLIPLKDLMPDWVCPRCDKTVDELVDELSADNILIISK